MRSLLRPCALLIVSATLLAACDSGSSPSTQVRYTVDGPAVVSFTAADGSVQQATTTAAWQTNVSVDAGTAVALAATSASASPVTASVFVDDALVGSRRGRSVRVESSGSASGEAEVRGAVEALGADRLTVAGRVFLVDGGTRLLDRAGAPVPLTTFAVGTYVEAEGRPLADGTFRATKVKLEDESDDDGSGTEVEVHGALQAVDADAFTVGGRRFVTSSSTRYLDRRNTSVARASFAVGDLVEAEGHVLADGNVQTSKIKHDD